MRGYRLRLNDYGRHGCHKQHDFVELAPEVSVNLKKWISFEKFCSLPPTLQKLYVQTLVNEYRVGGTAFAECWGVSSSCTGKRFAALGIELPPGTRKADKQRFIEFTRGEIKEEG